MVWANLLSHANGFQEFVSTQNMFLEASSSLKISTFVKGYSENFLIEVHFSTRTEF